MAVGPDARFARRTWRQKLKDLKALWHRNPRIVIGGSTVLVLVFLALLAPLITPYDPTAADASVSLQAPSGAHWFGTDDLGRDVFSRMVWGARLSLSVGLISVSIGLLVGVGVGLAAGYVGGLVDLLAMRAIDALLAFPALILAIRSW